jgi:hypothetical protein
MGSKCLGPKQQIGGGEVCQAQHDGLPRTMVWPGTTILHGGNYGGRWMRELTGKVTSARWWLGVFQNPDVWQHPSCSNL